jgi:ATP-dependent Clp protease adaptor protein ClpS
VLVIATMHAGERGHPKITVPHVALALLSDPDVAGLLEQRGATLEAVYEDLERLLPARGERAVTLKAGDHTAGVVSLLRASGAGNFRTRPRHVFGQLLGSQHPDIRSVFERHGITAPRLRQPAPRRDVGANDGAASSVRGPYRAPPSPTATTAIRFWNDDKTRMEFVAETLRGVFAIAEPRASALMLTIHRNGAAVVGTYEREQAELLAATTLRLARDRGFPLKLTLEESNRRKPVSRLARWLRRSSTASEGVLPLPEVTETPQTESAWASFGEPIACPCCGEASKRYRKISDALVCPACGRSFARDG